MIVLYYITSAHVHKQPSTMPLKLSHCIKHKWENQLGTKHNIYCSFRLIFKTKNLDTYYLFQMVDCHLALYIFYSVAAIQLLMLY